MLHEIGYPITVWYNNFKFYHDQCPNDWPL